MRVDEHTIDLDGSPAFFRRAWAGSSTPLLLHGMPTDSGDWRTVLAALGGLAPDLPGFGQTGKGAHLDLTAAGQADFLLRLLERLGIERVSVIAHGWGAGAAVALARRRPEHVERLVLISPLPLWPGSRRLRLARLLRTPGLGELAMGAVNRRLLGRALRRGSATPQTWPPERIAELWQRFDQGTQRAILRLVRAPEEDVTLPAGLATLLVCGERDPWLPPSACEEIARRLPGARRIVLPEAGHWPWLDDPDAVLAHLSSFLAGE